MSIIHAIILGLVQGLTEFLPVSSSGHLVLFQKIFGLSEATQSFDILLHMGTLIAVFICYWEDIWNILRKPFQKITYLLIAATLPTVVIALLFNSKLEAVFGSGNYLGILFFITSAAMFFADTRKDGNKKIKDMSYADAIIIGIMQGIAICPAVSRSGMTIAAALAIGLRKNSAARFSFLMSIPAILGAMVFTLKDMASGEAAVGEAMGVFPVAVGFVVAAVSGFLAINFMIKIINRGKLKYFGIYTAILGAYLCLDQFVLHIIY